MTITAFVLMLVSGLALLFMGRQLFWVYVALLGFLLGFELTQQTIATDVQWLPVLAGLLVGIGAALVAIVFQYVAIGLAGFVGGAYLVLSAFGIASLGEGGVLVAVVALGGGAVGTVLFLLLFDPALVVLSAITGASLLIAAFALQGGVAGIVFAGLVLIGIVFQFVALSRPEPPGKRKV